MAAARDALELDYLSPLEPPLHHLLSQSIAQSFIYKTYQVVKRCRYVGIVY